MGLADAELADRYQAIYPGAVTDAMDDMGYGRQTLPIDIEPLSPDVRMAGVAFTILGRPDPDPDFEANIRRFLEMLAAAPADSVLVYETHDDDAAHLGELSTHALDAGGARGAVIDGGVRDVRLILEQGFPVFSRYTTPKDAPPRWRLEDWNVPVTIGEVEVRPGDVLVGDVDGVACVPRAVAEEVLERAEALVATESDIREEVRGGMDPLQAYEEYGEF